MTVDEVYDLCDSGDNASVLKSFVKAATPLLRSDIYAMDRIRLLTLLGTAVPKWFDASSYHEQANKQWNVANSNWNKEVDGVGEQLRELRKKIDSLGQALIEEVEAREAKRRQKYEKRDSNEDDEDDEDATNDEDAKKGNSDLKMEDEVDVVSALAAPVQSQPRIEYGLDGSVDETAQ